MNNTNTTDIKEDKKDPSTKRNMLTLSGVGGLLGLILLISAIRGGMKLAVQSGDNLYEQRKSVSPQASRASSREANDHSNRGVLLSKRGEYDKAITEFNEAIRLEQHPIHYSNRGHAWRLTGDYLKAIDDYNTAISIDPRCDEAYHNRAVAWNIMKEYDKALSDYNEAIRLAPNDLTTCSSVAWFLSTCPDEKYVDGFKAIELATRACERTIWLVPDKLDTLAAAYAAAGDFEKSVEWQQKAVDLAPNSSKEEYESRLGLYLSGVRYKENN